MQECTPSNVKRSINVLANNCRKFLSVPGKIISFILFLSSSWVIFLQVGRDKNHRSRIVHRYPANLEILQASLKALSVRTSS